MENDKLFEVVILGILFDPRNKKIMIAKRQKDQHPNLVWCFPGGRLNHGKDVDIALKEKMKLKTGYLIKNLGAIFSKTYPEKPNLLSVYFLTEAFQGQEKPGDDIVELKWVNPKELHKFLTTSFHPKLRQFLEELV